jgi:hypothetical protein
MSSNEFQDRSKELPEPWYWYDNDLTLQLFKEMPDDHILVSKSLKTIAKCLDKDDVLFQIENDPFKYAVVHLTWSNVKQTDNNYPRTILYKDWNDLTMNRILADKAIFEE